MLVDHATITVKSGNGGMGCFKTRFKRPIGGDGGKGGDVIIEGSIHVRDLGQFRGMTQFEAQNGQSGQQDGKQGKSGSDFTVYVPFGTDILINDTLITSITNEQPHYVVVHGKKGALGNESLKRLGYGPSDMSTIQRDIQGETVTIDLDFKLQADVLFIGYPNAGKSSMLNRLTNTKVKVADYAFTTLEPQLGRMNGITLMDLPGLIDGTHAGRGLGTAFLKHTLSSKLLVHFVALDATDPLESYKTLRKELADIDTALSKKNEVILLTKSDEVSPEKKEQLLKEFKKINAKTIACSVIDDDSIRSVVEAITKEVRAS